MRLADLEPRWATPYLLKHPNGAVQFFGETARSGMGMTFRCPHCAERLSVFFANPIDGGTPADLPPRLDPTGNPTPAPLWSRTGESFETLTLQPSVDAAGHWHGFITAGEIT